MASVETVGDANDPVSVLTRTRNGNNIDLNNIPGLVKARLIIDGQMSIDDFMSPANMPGIKLKKLREEHRAKYEKVLDGIRPAEGEINDDQPNEEANKVDYPVGSFVMFNDVSYEVFKAKQDKVLIELTNKNKKIVKTWVPKSKVTKG